MNNIEINLSKNNFDANAKKYLAKWKEDSPNESEDMDSYSLEPNFEDSEVVYENDEIKVSGALTINGEYAGYLSFYLEVDSDLASDIIEAQVKKYNKIKTILEATK